MSARARRVLGLRRLSSWWVSSAGAAIAAPTRSRVAVIVVARFSPAGVCRSGRRRLIVPGAGSTVTRAGALSSLVRGRVVSSLLGGEATGHALIRLSQRPAEITIYVALPTADGTGTPLATR